MGTVVVVVGAVVVGWEIFVRVLRVGPFEPVGADEHAANRSAHVIATSTAQIEGV